MTSKLVLFFASLLFFIEETSAEKSPQFSLKGKSSELIALLGQQEKFEERAKLVLNFNEEIRQRLKEIPSESKQWTELNELTAYLDILEGVTSVEQCADASKNFYLIATNYSSVKTKSHPLSKTGSLSEKIYRVMCKITKPK